MHLGWEWFIDWTVSLITEMENVATQVSPWTPTLIKTETGPWRSNVTAGQQVREPSFPVCLGERASLLLLPEITAATPRIPTLLSERTKQNIKGWSLSLTTLHLDLCYFVKWGSARRKNILKSWFDSCKVQLMPKLVHIQKLDARNFDKCMCSRCWCTWFWRFESFAENDCRRQKINLSFIWLMLLLTGQSLQLLNQ